MVYTTSRDNHNIMTVQFTSVQIQKKIESDRRL